MSAIRRVHLVYPHGTAVSAPDTIGRHLAAELSKRWDVELHDWSRKGTLQPDRAAALIGHAHPVPGTLFRSSAKQAGWGRVLMLQPFNGDLRQIFFVRSLIAKVDAWLALAGPYWFARAADSPLRGWRPKLVRLDLAVDRYEFPAIKNGFAPAGRRRFVFIGGNSPMKNTGYLSEIARRAPDLDLSWIGPGAPIEGVHGLGPMDFSDERARRIVATHDFMVTVGTHDANPTTVLEAMAWGLLPVCTPQSGYSDEAGVINIPLRDVEACVRTLRHLRDCDGEPLRLTQEANWERVTTHYTWSRLGDTVADHIARTPLGLPLHGTARLQLGLAVAAATSRLAPYRAPGRRMWKDVGSQVLRSRSRGRHDK